MELSIIIPSYNGAHKIINALNCMEKQTFPYFEVIIVIDGSTDNSIDLLNSYQSSYPITIINQSNQGRSASRNHGVDSAQAELLVFLDDDMLPENEFLQKHYEFHQKHKNSALVGSAFRNPCAAKTSFDQYLIEVEKEWKQGIDDNFKVSIEHFAFTGANFSISKSNFYKIGKFKCVLPDTEDFDFGVRTLINKIDIYYNISVVAWHNDFCSVEKFIKRLQEYKISKKKLFEINPDYKLLFPQHCATAKRKPIKLAVLYVVLKLRLQESWLNSYFFKLMPLEFKFWFYRLIISAHLNFI